MEPEMIEGLVKELNAALKAMSKAKDINEKEAYSRIIKNISEAMGVFLNFANDNMPYDEDFDDEFDDEFDEEDDDEDVPF